MKPTLGDELMHPSDWLAAVDLKNQEHVVTIESVSKEDLMMVGGKKERKPVIRFKGKQKKLVCNKTNGSAIASLHGTKAELWVGKQITIYPTVCQVGSIKDFPCIRVKGAEE